MQVPATFSLGRTVARIFQRRGHRGYSPDCHVDRCRPSRRAEVYTAALPPVLSRHEGPY